MKPPDPYNDPQSRDPISMSYSDEDNSISSDIEIEPEAHMIEVADFGPTYPGMSRLLRRVNVLILRAEPDGRDNVMDEVKRLHQLFKGGYNDLVLETPKRFNCEENYSALSYTWADQEKHNWPTNVPKTTFTMTESRYEGFVLKKANPLVGERCPWAREHRQGAFSRRSDLSRHIRQAHQIDYCQKCENRCRRTSDLSQDSVDAYPEATHQFCWSLDNLTTGDHDPGDDGHTLGFLTWTDQICRQCSCPQLSR